MYLIWIKTFQIVPRSLDNGWELSQSIGNKPTTKIPAPKKS